MYYDVMVIALLRVKLCIVGLYVIVLSIDV